MGNCLNKWIIVGGFWMCFLCSAIVSMKKPYNDHEGDHVDQRVTCSERSSLWLYFSYLFGRRGHFSPSIGTPLEHRTFRMKWVSRYMLGRRNHSIECQLNPIEFARKFEIQSIFGVAFVRKIKWNVWHIRKIFRFTDSDLLAFKRIYANYTKVQSFIDNYDEKDIAAVLLDSNSTTLWTITPPNLQRFKNDLNGNAMIKFRFTISVSRRTYNQYSDRIEKGQEFHLTADHPARKQLLNAINSNHPNHYVHFVNLLPKFIKVLWYASFSWATIHYFGQTICINSVYP